MEGVEKCPGYRIEFPFRKLEKHKSRVQALMTESIMEKKQNVAKRNIFINQLKKITLEVQNSRLLTKWLPKLKSPVYWKPTRTTLSKAALIGTICAFLPVPFQMLLGSVLAYVFKANIPFATMLAWITNPLTMIPIWFTGYSFGVWLLDITKPELEQGVQLFSYEWFEKVLPEVWLPLYAGNLILGVAIGGALAMAIKFWPSPRKGII